MNQLLGVLVGVWCFGGMVGYYTAKGTSKRRCVRPTSPSVLLSHSGSA
jgi:hypothetical protein